MTDDDIKKMVEDGVERMIEKIKTNDYDELKKLGEEAWNEVKENNELVVLNAKLRERKRIFDIIDEIKPTLYVLKCSENDVHPSVMSLEKGGQCRICDADLEVDDKMIIIDKLKQKLED